MTNYDEELAHALEVAREAAAIARVRAGGVKSSEKENLGFVTDLDHHLELLIRKRLADRFPDDQLTGEEYEASGGQGPRRWSIDPIDGTGNLVHGLPLWAISIGLLDRGEPVVGVIAVPPQGELFWAAKGEGAWRDGIPIAAASDGDHFHKYDNMCVGTNALRVLDARTLPGRLRSLGSVCCELVYTASGKMAASTFMNAHLHDLAAGAVIAHEAGCRFGTVDGLMLTPAEFLASTPLRVPTFVAPAHRLKALMAGARALT